jgi:SAM-dependent methyltransferase
VAKTQRAAYPDLPLSASFYALLRTLGARQGLDLKNPDALARGVAELSRLYTREREELSTGRLGTSAGARAARLGFFLPRDLVKLFGPLEELRRAGRFPARPRLRVLDLGAGLGASTLGLSRYVCHAGLAPRELEVIAIERDAGSARLMRALCEAVGELRGEFAPIDASARVADLRGELAERGPFDLVLLGFVLNELDLERPELDRNARSAELLRALCARLAPDGALIALEPALKQSARELMQVRDLLAAAHEPERAGPPFVFAPCVRRGPCPMLAEALDFALPAPLADVAQRAGLRYQGLSYAALVLTNQPRTWPEETGVRYRVVSDRLRSKGKLELFGCGEPGYVRLTRLDRDASAGNAPFEELRRGDVVELPDGGPRVGRESLVRKQ